MSIRQSILLIAFVSLLFSGIEASALTIAVFPLDDLTLPSNSVNLPMTDILRNELSRKGLTVTPRAQVESFMSGRRIRHLGLLQAEEVLAVRKELGADLVLLGSVCQQSDTASAIGITVSVLRTSDAKTIWSSTQGASLIAEQRLLGINAPSSMDDLRSILIRDLFVSWPKDPGILLGRKAGQVDQDPRVDNPAVEVDSVLFTPKYVRPGQEVKCSIRFKVRRGEERAKVYVRVGNRVHLAQTDDGVYYKVSWVGSEGKPGAPVKVAMNSSEPRIISGIWNGEPEDADYPVSLILEWPSGKRDESFLGTYVVDSRPPEVFFKVHAKLLDGLPAFRRELPLSVFFKRSEPIEKWAFAIVSPEGKILLEEKGNDQPPDSFLWQGQDSKNQRLDPGTYDVRLTVWDRAGNMARATDTVRLLSGKPGLDLVVDRQQDRVLATLSAVDRVGITFWRMELWSRDNTMLKAFEGHSLPARIELSDAAATGAGPIDGLLQVRDALGMRATKKVPNLLAKAVRSKGAADDGKGAAAVDNASDDWHPDF